MRTKIKVTSWNTSVKKSLNAGSQEPVPAPSPGINLGVAGLGHVPSFKNCKRAILDRKSGKMRTLTDPKAAEWMKRCIRSFESQLLSQFLIGAGVTWTVQELLSWIASFMPYDDCGTCVSELHLKVLSVKKGMEGAIITVERL